MADKDYNQDGKIDEKDDKIAQYDYNKDGFIDMYDVSSAGNTYNELKGSWWQTTQNQVGAGIVIGGAGGARAGWKGALIGGIGGGLFGLVSGTIEWNNLTNENKEQITSFLKNAYGYNDTEVEEFTKRLDIVQRLIENDETNVGKNNQIAERIITLANNISTISIPGDKISTWDRMMEMNQGNIFSTEAIKAGWAGITGTSEQEYIQQQLTELKAELNKAGIKLDLTNVPPQKIEEVVNKALEATLTPTFGVYNFSTNPIDEANLPVSEEEKAILDKTNQRLIEGQIRLNENPNMTPTNTTPGMGGADEQPTLGTVGNQYTQEGTDGGKVVSTTLPNNKVRVETFDKDGNKVDTKEMSDVEAWDKGLVPKPDYSSGGKNPNHYIGLNSSDNTVIGFGPNGERITNAKAQYKYSNVMNYFDDMTTEEILLTKRKLYGGGYYGSSDIYSAASANLTQADYAALEQAMGDANFSGQTVDTFLQPKYETFLLTGRPVGEDAVDLNGDGVKDANVSSALRAFVARNGINVSDNYIKNFESKIVSGETTLEEAMKNIREKFVANAFPAWKDEIMAGTDIIDIAKPYFESIAEGLEITPESISLNDPLIKKALSGVDDNGKPTYVPLHQLETMIRQDSRWDKTTTAQKEYADAANYILQMFGIYG